MCATQNDALLVITPLAHVPHLDAHTGLWTRYDLSPKASIVSVQLADLNRQAARPPSVGGRYTSRTRVHFTLPEGEREHSAAGIQVPSSSPSTTAFRAEESLAHIGASCSLPAVSSCGLKFAAEPSWACDWTYGRRFKGLDMGTATTNVIATIVLAGPRADGVAAAFESLRPYVHVMSHGDLRTSSEQACAQQHRALGLSGDAHIAVQPISTPSGDFTVARVGTEHREDMHRLLHHCLSPLETELGDNTQPYGRTIKATRTSPSMSHLFGPSPFIVHPELLQRNAKQGESNFAESPSLHVQYK